MKAINFKVARHLYTRVPASEQRNIRNNPKRIKGAFILVLAALAT